LTEPSLSGAVENSTQPVSPKSDEGGSPQDAKAQGKLESFFASPQRLSRRSLTKADGDLALKFVAGW